MYKRQTERCFFIELSEIITGKEMKGAKCTKKAGAAPKQTIDFEEMAAAGGFLDLDENFYGYQDFDMEDFDKEGFGGLDEAGNSFEAVSYTHLDVYKRQVQYGASPGSVPLSRTCIRGDCYFEEFQHRCTDCRPRGRKRQERTPGRQYLQRVHRPVCGPALGQAGSPERQPPEPRRCKPGPHTTSNNTNI